MSRGFYVSVILSVTVYLVALTWTLQVHLEHEQAWTKELLDQNTHSLGVIAAQKDALSEAGTLLGYQDRYIRALEGKLYELLLGE